MSQGEEGEEAAADLGLEPGLARAHQSKGAEEVVVVVDWLMLEQILTQERSKDLLTMSPRVNRALKNLRLPDALPWLANEEVDLLLIYCWSL
jgi:hypothetical protein